jgi:hypothetical protein
MTPVVLVIGVAATALLLALIALGLSRSEGLKRQVGALFRRAPRSKPSRPEHYYKPYWSR